VQREKLMLEEVAEEVSSVERAAREKAEARRKKREEVAKRKREREAIMNKRDELQALKKQKLEEKRMKVFTDRLREKENMLYLPIEALHKMRPKNTSLTYRKQVPHYYLLKYIYLYLYLFICF
jgi:hypothetical protein